jgi:UDP-glucose 4-epimerase
MKILVTGGAGFIGSHIVDAYIKLGHKVTVLDNFSSGKKENINPEANVITADINDNNITEIFEKENFDIVSHHAAQMNVRVSVDDPKFDANTNIIGSINIFEAARRSGVKKIIFASSGGTIYGEQEKFPAEEDDRKAPCSPYGISKLSTEHYLFYYQSVYGIDRVVLRYGNVYGARQNPHGEAGVVAIFINKMLAGEQPIINGDGLITRDYIYIEDVVAANVKALDEAVNGIYNVTTGMETNVNHIFRRLKELTGSNCEEYHGPAKAGEQRRSVCSYSKYEKMHGWYPKMKFDEGMEQTVKAFKEAL